MSAESRRAAAERLRDAFVAEKGEAWIRFQGRSMAPMLCDGDMLRVRHGASGLARGAIVVFNDGDTTIVHRFLYRRRHGSVLVTKGDNAWRIDRPFAPERLIGTVCEIRRGDDRIELDRGGWRWVSRGIAWTSLLEGIAFACAAALRRRCLPRRLVGRIGEARALAAIARCRRAAIDRLLRAMPSTDVGTA